MDLQEKRKKRREYMREYYKKNPDKVEQRKAQVKAKRRNDPEWAEKQRAHGRELISRDPQKNRDRAKAWQQANPERYKEAQRKAHAKNKAARVLKAKEWKQANPERAKVLALDTAHRRRARKAGGDEEGCWAVITAWRAKARFTCAICSGRFLSKGCLQIDHIIPLSKGGPHIPSNLQPVCKPCNLSKAARLEYNA